MTLLELLGLLKKNLKLVVILPLVCAIGMGAYAFMGMEDEYTATASMYVLAKQDEIGDNLNTILAFQMVANDVATLLKSDRVRDLAARDLGVKSLAGFDISVTSETTSRVLSVTVTGDDPKQVAELANSRLRTFPASLRTSCKSRPSTSSTAQTPHGTQRSLACAVYRRRVPRWPVHGHRDRGGCRHAQHQGPFRR